MTIDPLAWIALAFTVGVTILVAVVILVANELAVYRRSRRGGVVDLTGISAYGYRADAARNQRYVQRVYECGRCGAGRHRDGKDAA